MERTMGSTARTGDVLIIDGMGLLRSVQKGHILGTATRDIKKGEIIDCRPGGNTEDILTHAAGVADEDFEVFQTVYLDTEGKIRAVDDLFLEVPTGGSLEDNNAPT